MKNAVCPPQECTLCMACVNICPQDAISLGRDAYGYEKLQIDQQKCVDCGLCEKVCGSRKNIVAKEPVQCYAAQAKDGAALAKSASGGAFQMIARLVLEAGGVVYGCAMEKKDGIYEASHIRVDTLQKLPKILGSKYIPSVIGDAFRQAKKDLEAGVQVLFSGTPCQIQGLKAYLGKAYEQLLTVDLVCHGVTAGKMFNDYLQELERRDGIVIEDYHFRDKSISWGTNYCYQYRTEKQERVLVRHCPREESSYMRHYLKGNIFRENCYSCSLSASERVSDFTLGDFWEIEVEHPEFIIKHKPHMVLRRGISCILVNTEKANSYISQLTETMHMHPVSLDSIRRHNSNLCEPSHWGKKRQWVLETYKKEGYGAIEEDHRKALGKKIKVYRLKNRLKSRLPDRVRIWIYRSALLRRIVFHQ